MAVKRLLRLFMLIALRILIVCALSTWGLSNFATPAVTWQQGWTAWDVMVCQEGIVAGYLDGDLVPRSAYVLPRPTSWKLNDDARKHISHRSLLGFHYWSSSVSFARVGVHWLTLLATLVICYAFVHRWGKRRRIASLKDRMQQAKNEHVAAHS